MLESKRLVLTPLEAEDLPLLVEWRNDPTIAPWFFNALPLTRSGQEEWYRRYLTNRTQQIFIIRLKSELRRGEDGKPFRVPIGTHGFTLDWENRAAELGNILIIPAYRGNGYASEAEKLVIDYCFDHIGVHKLTGELFADNEAILHVHKKAGFQIEGILRQARYRNGWRDVVVIGMLCDERR